MTIRMMIPSSQQGFQPSQASDYYDELEQRFKDQAVARVPRSQRSWSAEQARLGAWNTGVAHYTPVGTGVSYPSGWAPPRFSYDPDQDDEAERLHP